MARARGANYCVTDEYDTSLIDKLLGDGWWVAAVTYHADHGKFYLTLVRMGKGYPRAMQPRPVWQGKGVLV